MPAVDLSNLTEDAYDPREPYARVLTHEPLRFDGDMDPFQQLLVGASIKGASDIRIQTDSRIRIKMHGTQHFATAKPLNASEVLSILSHMWRSEDAFSILRQGRPLDFSFEVPIDRHRRQRFRVNAKGVMKGAGDGISMTMRPLPTKTPTIDDVGLDSEVRPYMSPQHGIVVVAGATGQGKSTTLAGITRFHLENTADPKAIVDLQAPIEFTYSDVLTDHSDCASSIEQSEIGEGRNLPSFGAGVWAALRCAPDIISLGEARDKASLEGCLEASLTGHLVYTTTHAGSVAEGLRRMVVNFPAEERDARAFDLITSLQLFVVQHLVRTSDHRGRVPLREYLLFDDYVRDQFVSVPIGDWPKVVSRLMQEPADRVLARSMHDAAQQKVDEGKVSYDDVRRLLPRH